MKEEFSKSYSSPEVNLERKDFSGWQLKDVEVMLKLNAQLAEVVGQSAELFIKFLEANFPNFEQNIFWHGSSSEKIEGEIRLNKRDSGWFGNGFYLSSESEYSRRWGKNLHPMLIPIGKYAAVKSNQYEIELIGDAEKANNEAGGSDAWILDELKYSQKFTEALKRLGNVGVKVEMEGYKDAEVVVFDPSQIHILGSDKDIESLKRWVGEKANP